MTNTDTRTSEEKAAYRNACRHAGVIRVYFYDIDTREEITLEGNSAGLIYVGNSENAIRGGVRYTDTTLGVSVTDHAKRIVRTVTAEDFPGRRVAVKIWVPEGAYGECGPATEFKYLADLRNGFAGNEADTGKLGREVLGRSARQEAVHV